MKHLLNMFFVVLTIVSCNKADLVNNKDNTRNGITLTKSQEYLITKGNGFALSFLDYLSDYSESSIVFSPLSLQFSLGMVMNATQGETCSEIIKTLDFPDDLSESNNLYKNLFSNLPSLDKKATVSFNNAAFFNKDKTIFDSYKNTILDVFGAKSYSISTDKQGLKQISDWIYSCANEEIQPIVNDFEDSEVVALLVNVASFKGQWSKKFDLNSLKGVSFTNEKGDKCSVIMMQKEDTLPYALTGLYSAVELAYGTGAYVMDIILPKDGYSTKDVINNLKTKGLPSYNNNMFQDEIVNVRIPRFTVSQQLYHEKFLQEMGISLAFSHLGDFTPLTPEKVKLEHVCQFSNIKVDEHGTEAKAASSSQIKGYSSTSSRRFVADRTFLFFIKETSTGAILFAGKYDGD